MWTDKEANGIKERVEEEKGTGGERERERKDRKDEERGRKTVGETQKLSHIALMSSGKKWATVATHTQTHKQT